MSDTTGQAPAPASIGEATMEPDGTIVLRLRATGPDAVGEAVSRYTPDDPHYKSIRDHLPNLQPASACRCHRSSRQTASHRECSLAL